MRRVLIGLMLFFGVSGSAFGQAPAYMRGIDLLSMCRMEGADIEKNNHEFCQTYVAGVVDYHNMLRSLDAEPPVTFCIPAQYSIRQVTEIVLNELASAPQHDHFTAAPAVTLALFKAFPCKIRK